MSRSILLGAVTRRTVVNNLGFAAIVAVLPDAQAPFAGQARSAEPPHLDVKDSAAMAVGYLENASDIDPKKYPAYVKGTSCENCLLLQGTSGPHYRPCTLFPGKVVSVRGWCSGWTAEI